MKRFVFSILFLVGLLAHAQTSVDVIIPGTLSSLINVNDKYSITNLVVKGSINGTDIAFLRDMCGKDANGQDTAGKLSSLDLSSARIVEGGSIYLNSKETPPSGMSHTAQELSQMMGCGWNLGNSLEVPVSSITAETAWGNPMVNEQLIDSVKAAGFNTVRIPVSWNVHMLANGQIDPAWMTRVKEVVGYCIENEMYVIINCHYDDNWLQTRGFTDLSEQNVQRVVEKQYSIWKQVAESFATYDEHLMFAGTNEPSMNSGVNASKAVQAALDRYLQAFVDAVRSTGGNNTWRTLIVQSLGAGWDTALNHTTFMPTDPTPGRMMFEVHFYDPVLFALFEEDQSWGSCNYYWGNGNHISTSVRNTPFEKEYSLVDDVFSSIHDRFVKHGIPVLVGEYAAVYRNVSSIVGEDQERHNSSIEEWSYYVTNSILKYGMVPCYWDPGARKQPTMGIFKRARGDVFNSYAMSGIKKAMKENLIKDSPKESNVNEGYSTANDVIGAYMFSGCNSLRSIILPSTTYSISESAFENCMNLRSVNIGVNIRMISPDAFSGCVMLQEIISPAAIPSVCSNTAFADDMSSCKLYVAENRAETYSSSPIWSGFNVIGMPYTGREITSLDITLSEGEHISDVIPSIEMCKVEDYKLIRLPNKFGLQSLRVSGEINSSDIRYIYEMLGRDVYGKATSGKLKSVDLTNARIVSGGLSHFIDLTSGNRYNTIDDVFPSHAFANSNITSIAMPSTIKSIGSSALIQCFDLTSVTLPEGLTSIGDSVLCYCNAMTSISLPNSLETIGNYSMMNTGITNLRIPDRVYSLGQRGFADSKIVTIVIGSGLSDIGSQAFRGCTSLSTIYVLPTIPPYCNTDAFKWVTKSGVKLLVPPGTVSSYSNAEVWKNFTDISEMTSADGIDKLFEPMGINSEIFDLSGIKIHAPQKGMNIIKATNNKTIKIFSR